MIIEKDLKTAHNFVGSYLPADWELLGVVKMEQPHREGALVRTQSGMFVRYNAGVLHMLPQMEVIDCLERLNTLSGAMEDIARTAAKGSGAK